MIEALMSGMLDRAGDVAQGGFLRPARSRRLADHRAADARQRHLHRRARG
jgi:hypothetical protein